MTDQPTTRLPLHIRIGRNPWILLLLTTFFWGGNVVAARVAVGEISPIVLVGLRWVICTAVVLVVVRRNLLQTLRELRPHWAFLLLMGALGFTASNTLLYEGARFTSGVNVAIIQGVLPVMVLAGARIMWGVPIGPVRAVGVTLTVLGIMLIASEGDLSRLAQLQFNKGDLLALLSAALYSLYTLALRNRPPVSGFAFFIGLAIAAMASSVPAMAVETALGASIWPGWKGLLVLLYVAIFTSLLGQLFWIRAVELIGPGRTGVFQNLVPVMGALCAVVFLREDFHWYHAASLALVLGGLMISERFGR